LRVEDLLNLLRVWTAL